MSTAAPRRIVVYSHSMLFYWWPVWAVGFIMAATSYMSDQRLAIVPAGTVADVDGLAAPKGKHMPVDPATQEVLQPKLHVSSSKNVGVLFCAVLLSVILSTNVPLRGLWSAIVIGVIIFTSIIFAILDWWDPILTYLGLLDIRMNMGGYLLISTVLFAVWCIVFFWFDKQIYMIFSPGLVRVCLEIGSGETGYPTVGMVLQKQRSDLFRHLILGFGSGDLIVKTAGASTHVFDLPNVMALGRRFKEIEVMVQSQVVIAK